MGIFQISSVCRSKKAVNAILLQQPAAVAVTVKLCQQHKGHGNVMLVLLSTINKNVYIFDIKLCPDIVHEGELWRLLLSTDLVKVMHDCRKESAALRHQFNITMRNVFDTQAAYSLLLTTRQLPVRTIQLHDLYDKFGDPAQWHADALKYYVLSSGTMDWAQRPLSKTTLSLAMTSVKALIPAVYDNMKREIPENSWSTFEDLCDAFVTGKVKKSSCEDELASTPRTTGTRTPRTPKVSQSPRKPAMSKTQPILRLNDTHKHLLKGTIPAAAK